MTYAGVAKGMGADPGYYQKDAEYAAGAYTPKTVTVKRRALNRVEV